MNLSPVVLFVYNRPLHVLKTLQSLNDNDLADKTELFIYADGPKAGASQETLDLIKDVRTVIGSRKWCRKVNIIESEVNKGLARSVIDGVTSVINSYGRVIVLEDDMTISKYFLRFVNEALDVYANDDEVISITGYLFPVKAKMPETFFLKGTYCWGWATWKRGWDIFNSNGKELLEQIENRKLSHEFDFYGTHHYTQMLREQAEGKNDSWALPWYASAFLKDKLTLLPGKSLVSNIGLDSTGTHGDETNKWNVSLSGIPIEVKRIALSENIIAKKHIANFFKSLLPKRKFKSIVKSAIKRIISPANAN